MRLDHSWRRLILTVHIGASVGWLGAAYVGLVLAVVGLTTPDAGRRAAAYQVLDLLDLAAWVPLGGAAVGTGFVLGMGTKWGLVRYWWVLAKLVGGGVVLVVPLLARSPNVDRANAAIAAGAPVGGLAVSVLAPCIASVVVLSISTALSTYKPGGRTPWSTSGSPRRPALRSRSATPAMIDG